MPSISSRHFSSSVFIWGTTSGISTLGFSSSWLLFSLTTLSSFGLTLRSFLTFSDFSFPLPLEMRFASLLFGVELGESVGRVSSETTGVLELEALADFFDADLLVPEKRLFFFWHRWQTHFPLSCLNKNKKIRWRQRVVKNKSYLLIGGSRQLGWKALAQVSQLSSFPFLPHTMHTLSMVFCRKGRKECQLRSEWKGASGGNYFVLTIKAKPVACRNCFHFRLETIQVIAFVAQITQK